MRPKTAVGLGIVVGWIVLLVAMPTVGIAIGYAIGCFAVGWHADDLAALVTERDARRNK